MSKPVRAALYVRCSTLQQNLDLQLNDLTRYAAARGFEVVDVYQDHGVSGVKDSRPALDQMVREAKRRHFDTICVWRLDRLGRNTRHLLTLIEDLEAHQIRLVSYMEGFDLATPTGRVMASILSALATFERELIRERCLAGIEAAKKRGKKFGRPRTVDRTRVIQLRKAGLSFRQIGRELGISHGAVAEAIAAEGPRQR